MDQLKKFTTNELIILGGALAVFIGYFLKWFSAEARGVGDFGISGDLGSVSGSEYFLQGTLPWLLAIAVAVVLILVKMDKLTLPELPMPLSQIILIVSGLIAFLIITRLIIGEDENEFVEVNRGLGLFLATIGGIAMAVGAFLKFQAKEEDEGGTSTAPPTPF